MTLKRKKISCVSTCFWAYVPSHKGTQEEFLGRAVVSQIDDPTYKICKILTDILNPLAINGQSFVENSYDLKKTLAMIQVDKDDIQASFDVIALYPSIPIDKALDCIRERLQKE